MRRFPAIPNLRSQWTWLGTAAETTSRRRIKPAKDRRLIVKRRDFAGSLVAVGFPGAAPAASGQSERIPRPNTEMDIGGDYYSVVGGSGADMTTQGEAPFEVRPPGADPATATLPVSVVSGDAEAV